LLSELDWISSTDQTSTQELVGIFFNNFFEINVISFFNLLLFTFLLLFIHKIELILGLILFNLFLVLNVIFFTRKLTNMFDKIIVLLWKNLQDPFSGSDDILLTDFRLSVNIWKSLKSNLVAFS
jgi:hypothetical protein